MQAQIQAATVIFLAIAGVVALPLIATIGASALMDWIGEILARRARREFVNGSPFRRKIGVEIRLPEFRGVNTIEGYVRQWAAATPHKKTSLSSPMLLASKLKESPSDAACKVGLTSTAESYTSSRIRRGAAQKKSM